MDQRDPVESALEVTQRATRFRGAGFRTLWAAAALCVVIAGFAAVAFWRHTAHVVAPVAQLSGSHQTTQDWQVYHDPLGSFTMKLPEGWTTSQYLGTFTETSPAGSFSGKTENLAFHSAAMGLQIDVTDKSSVPSAMRATCGPRTQFTRDFNGIQAESPFPGLWLFDTQNAHYQINETIAGALDQPHTTLPNSPPPPTAQPTATVMAESSLLNQILATFQPTGAPLPTCP